MAARRLIHRIDSIPAQGYCLRAVAGIVGQSQCGLLAAGPFWIEPDVNDTTLLRTDRCAGAGVTAHYEILLVVSAEDGAVDVQLLPTGIGKGYSSGRAGFICHLIAEVDAAGIYADARRRFLLVGARTLGPFFSLAQNDVASGNQQ